MNFKEYTDAVTRIDEDLLEGALRCRETSEINRKRTVRKRALALAASFLLLLTGALVYRQLAPPKPISTEPTGDTQAAQTHTAENNTLPQDLHTTDNSTAQPSQNNTDVTTGRAQPAETETTNSGIPDDQPTTESNTLQDETQIADPTPVKNVKYTDLTADGKGLLLQKGGGMASIARFSENRFLTADSILIEGTALRTYVKQYHFTVDAPGKFENAGGRMTILYEPQTVITTVKVTKVWRGSGTVNTGDTLTFENEFLYSDGVFRCREGVTYVLYLERADGDTLRTGRPHEGADERITEGDNRRSCEYERGYPYQPAIEKTKDGDYIVPETWESLSAGTEADVLPELSDANGGALSENMLPYKLKLVTDNDFIERMQALAERL